MIRVALLCQGYETGGGVPAVASWLRAGLTADPRFEVDVHDLATSSRDASSRLLRRPRTWRRTTLRTPGATATHWGANAVELEPMRYRPRRELTAALSRYDIVQVVAGGPALACAAGASGRPVVLQFATFARWERASIAPHWSPPLRLARGATTAATTRLEHRAVRAATAVFVENAAMLDAVQRLGQHAVAKAWPGVDVERFRPASTPPVDGYVLSVCRLGDPRKGLPRIVRAYDRLRRSGESGRLVLAGKGRLDARTSTLVDELGLRAHVEVRPDVPVGALPDLYRGATAFVQASFEEGLGMSSVEAMASGVPVVATDTAGSREVVHDGVTGRLVPQGPDVEVADGLAAGVRDVLAARETLSAAARRRAVEHFSPGVTLAPYLDTYERLAGIKSRP